MNYTIQWFKDFNDGVVIRHATTLNLPSGRVVRAYRETFAGIGKDATYYWRDDSDKLFVTENGLLTG